MLLVTLKTFSPFRPGTRKRPFVRPQVSLTVPRLQGATEVADRFHAYSLPCLTDEMNEIRPDSKIVLYSVNKSVNLWSKYALKMPINGA